MSSLRDLLRFLPGYRPRLASPTVLVATDEHGRTIVLPDPASRDFWQQCPWAGDDEESVRFRRIIEQEFG